MRGFIRSCVASPPFLSAFIYAIATYISAKVKNNLGDTMGLSHGPIHTSGLLDARRCNL